MQIFHCRVTLTKYEWGYNKIMIDEEGNEIDDDLWTDMMEAYAQGFVSGGGGASGPSEELENEAVQNLKKCRYNKA